MVGEESVAQQQSDIYLHSKIHNLLALWFG